MSWLYWKYIQVGTLENSPKMYEEVHFHSVSVAHSFQDCPENVYLTFPHIFYPGLASQVRRMVANKFYINFFTVDGYRVMVK